MGQLQRTYSGARARSVENAGALSGVGAAVGDRVATLAPNRPELIDLFFGIPRLGVVQFC